MEMSSQSECGLSTVGKKSAEVTPGCDVCHTEGAQGVSICEVCEEFLCMTCDKAHRGSKATKCHQVIDIQQMSDSHKELIAESIEQVQGMKEHVERQSMRTKELINTLQEAKVKEIEKVNLIRQDLKKQVDDHHNGVIEQLENLFQKQLQGLESTEAAFQGKIEDLQRTTQVLTSARTCSEILMSLDGVQGLTSDVDKQLRNMGLDLATTEIKVETPYILDTGEGWDPNQSTRTVSGKTPVRDMTSQLSEPFVKLVPVEQCHSSGVLHQCVVSVGILPVHYVLFANICIFCSPFGCGGDD